MIFLRLGILEVVRSNNGIQYSSKIFKIFAESRRFQHITSSPEYPRSNGMVERYEQVIKNMSIKAKHSDQHPYLVIQVEGLANSAQLMCCQSLRSVLPCKQKKLKVQATTEDESYIEQRQKNLQNQARYYDRHSRQMNELHTGEKVSMQDSKTWKPAVVMKTSKFEWIFLFEVSALLGDRHCLLAAVLCNIKEY